MVGEPWDWQALKAARQKYLQLGREIERDVGIGSDLAHTHSKLGIFLGEALGMAWRAASESVPDAPPEESKPA